MIRTENLSRDFGGGRGLDGLTLEIPQGAIFGYIGPNGAGKTTTIKMFTTLIPLSGGSAKVAGFGLLENPTQVRSRIGVVPQEFAAAAFVDVISVYATYPP